jgi:hypothetical protein
VNESGRRQAAELTPQIAKIANASYAPIRLIVKRVPAALTAP